MKYIKSFERIERYFKVGDKVIYDDPFIDSCFGVAPTTQQAIYGDLCEITDVKISKGNELVKVKNLNNNKMICKLLNANGVVMSYNRDGSWFDNHYFKKLELFKPDFIYAVKSGNKDLIEKMLDEKPNPNIKDKCRRTPLIYAARNNDIELLIKLINLNADVSIEFNDGINILEIIKKPYREILQNNYPDIYEYIENDIEAGKYNL